MQPIQDLLARIQWDNQFAQAEFEIGYFDRVSREIIWVRWGDLQSLDRPRQMIELFDEEGELRHIPFHRIREVRRNGIPIWSRPL